MSKLVDKVLIIAASALLAVSTVGQANAASWIITDVLQVSNDGGFGASSFHDARGNEMSGSNLGPVTGSGVLGSYNDVTGALSLTANVANGGNNFQMTVSSTGGFLFNGSGFLASHNTLDLTFVGNDFDMPDALPSISAGTVTEMGFMLGDVCCSGTDNPNSFTQPGADGDERWITLWGANNFNTATGSYDYGSETTLGMDLRLRLERSGPTTEVPAPAATLILGLGLFGLAYTRRRKTV